MKNYLSHGGGLNSWALYLLLRDRGVEFEAVFASHGADWPETYQYMQDRIAEGYPITVLNTGDIYGYYWGYSMIPMRVNRGCTRKFKLEPLAAHMTTPCTVYLGIDAGESHRVDKLIAGQREGESKEFPLVDAGIDRRGCEQIITAHGLPIPIKSGCYLCPHQRVSQIRQLRTLHKDLFDKALSLERRANAARPDKGPYYLLDRPLDVVAMDNQPDLFGERDMSPCLCEL